MQVRQCSRTLQQLTDGDTGVGLTLAGRTLDKHHATALSLCSKSITRLDTSKIGSSRIPMPQLLRTISEAPAASFKLLDQLSVGVEQLELMNAVAAVSPCLSSIKLLSIYSLKDRVADAGAVRGYADALSKQLPGLSSLRSLELDSSAALLPLSCPSIASIIGRLTQLNSLTVGQPYPSPDITQRVWDAAIAPLVNLTRLDLQPSGIAKIHIRPSQLTGLQELVCGDFIDFEDDEVYDEETGSNYAFAWINARSHLTAVMLTTNDWYLDCQFFTRLDNLQSLTLRYTLQEGQALNSGHLCVLSACSKLTYLSLDEVQVEAAAEAAGEGGHAAGAAAEALGQLTGLKSLSVGVNGAALYRAPLSTFAPNITALQDLYMAWNEANYDAPTPLQLDFNGVDALAGLKQLRVLDVAVETLDRHVVYPSLTQLSSLCELQIDAGSLTNTVNLKVSGLPFMPHLTKLMLYTKLHEGSTLAPGEAWAESGDFADALLLWQQQSNLRTLQLSGSMKLGGFMTNDDLMALLPVKLPQLECVELVRCRTLTLLHLAKLVGSRAAACIVVKGCRPITERECLATQLSSGGAVVVEYSW